jgi:hypothetical protein
MMINLQHQLSTLSSAEPGSDNVDKLAASFSNFSSAGLVVTLMINLQYSFQTSAVLGLVVIMLINLQHPFQTSAVLSLDVKMS